MDVGCKTLYGLLFVPVMVEDDQRKCKFCCFKTSERRWLSRIDCSTYQSVEWSVAMLLNAAKDLYPLKVPIKNQAFMHKSCKSSNHGPPSAREDTLTKLDQSEPQMHRQIRSLEGAVMNARQQRTGSAENATNPAISTFDPRPKDVRTRRPAMQILIYG